MDSPVFLLIHFELEIEGQTARDLMTWGPFEDLDAAWDFYRDNPGIRAHSGGFTANGASVLEPRDPQTAAARTAQLAEWGMRIPTDERDPRAEWAQAASRGVEVPKEVVRRLLGAEAAEQASGEARRPR